MTVSQQALRALAAACRDDVIGYSCFVDRNYRPNRFHRFVARKVAAALARGHGRLIIQAPPQHGKQIADDTPVLTATRGWTVHGALRVGDQVFGPDGVPAAVVAVGPTAPQDCEVEFTDGTVIRCHERHEWTVFDRSGGKRWRTIETLDIERVRAYHGPRGQRGSRARFQLPPRASLQMPDAALPVEPYTLGAWLGDGSAGKSVITHAASDQAVVAAVGQHYPQSAQSAQWAHPTTGVLTTSFGGGPNRPGALTIGLRESGVLRNKHIPGAYLTASVRQRLELLAGLIDTDGYVFQLDQRVCFSTCEPALASDVAALVRTLGWRATVYEAEPATSSSGIEGRRTVYQVTFTPDRAVPTRLDRKRIEGRPGCQRRVGIAAVRRVAPTSGRCIQVDRDDGLYLVGRELVPTHNSRLLSQLMPAYAMGRYPTRRIIAASYGEELVQFNGAAVRDLVASPEHRLIFPEAPLSASTAAKDFFQTESGGRYLGTTVRGGATGHSAEIAIIDDPIKDRAEADSITVRKSIYDWYRSVLYTRLQQDSVLVLMMTRWHVDDLAGTLIREQPQEQWEVINLPALAEDGDALGREVGEPLVPERFDLQRLLQIRATLGGGDARDWLALYQQRPVAEGGGEFKDAWLQFYANVNGGRGMTKVILVDPASGRRAKEENDFTAIAVVGLGADSNYYLLDLVYDRLNLSQRTAALFRLHRKYRPEHPVRYEHYGMQADIEHIRSEQERLQYRFPIVEVAGATPKLHRIRRLVPSFSTGRWWLPNQLWYTNVAGQLVDLVNEFRENEYKPFPVGRHDHILDALARLFEPNEKQDPALELSWPGEERRIVVMEPMVALDATVGY
jgi:predicted phage terminase large subunit-like protein